MLASYIAADGTLRVPALAVRDGSGRDLITLSVVDGRAELNLRLPRAEGAEPTGVSLFADDGPAGMPDVEPSVGIDLSVVGSQAALLEVVPDLRGGWTLTRSTPEPPPGV
ncbi:MAG: hypothetical protein ACRDZR_00060 [Acidimicrobiales bacterium]